MTRAVDLTLSEAEQRWAAALVGSWSDLLYRPGPGFASPLEPGFFRASFLIVPVGAVAVRVTSMVVPAFGGELCRLRLEPVPTLPHETFGSFFDPTRRGRIWSMGADRGMPGAYAPDEKDWFYAGAGLAPHLGETARVQVLRERVRAGAGARELLGYGDHEEPFELTVELVPLSI
jgi:hypothetical protein